MNRMLRGILIESNPWHGIITTNTITDDQMLNEHFTQRQPWPQTTTNGITTQLHFSVSAMKFEMR